MNEETQVLPTEQEPVEETTEVVEDTDWQEVATKHQKAFTDQKLRAEKAEARLKELESAPKPKEEKSTPKNDDDRIALLEKRLEEESTRTRLTAMGVLETDEQDEVMRAAGVLGKSPAEAIRHPLVAKMLEDMRSQKKTEDVTPSPSRKSGTGTTNVERLATQVLKGEKSFSDLGTDDKKKVLEHIEKNNLF